MDASLMETYTAILREELIPAMGCTEPIAIALCAAKLRSLLGREPEQITAALSGNIIKNVKSVVVPNTDGRKGIRPAIAAGMVAGDPDAGLLVIASLPHERLPELDAFLERTPVEVHCSGSPCKLDIDLTATAGVHHARVRIAGQHTNIIYLECDGEILRDEPLPQTAEERGADRSVLNVEDILHYADETPLEAVAPLLERQIAYNSAIAREGLTGAWGAQIGRILLEDYGDDVKQRAKAYAAAGSDARMSGCEKPVVILSGSGNQGITAGRFRRGSARERASAICSAAAMRPWRTRSSTPWRSSRARSATARSRPARPRSPLRSTPGYWATGCTCTTANSAAARASSAARSTQRSQTSACWRSRECARPTPRSWKSCRNDRLWENFIAPPHVQTAEARFLCAFKKHLYAGHIFVIFRFYDDSIKMKQRSDSHERESF